MCSLVWAVSAGAQESLADCLRGAAPQVGPGAKVNCDPSHLVCCERWIVR